VQRLQGNEIPAITSGLFCFLCGIASPPRSSDTGFQGRFLIPLWGLRPVPPVPVLYRPGGCAAKRRTDAAVVPLAIDRPPSSRRVVLQDGWASAVSAGQEFRLRFYTHITAACVSRYAQRLICGCSTTGSPSGGICRLASLRSATNQPGCDPG
jgi:hypothetical protein